MESVAARANLPPQNLEAERSVLGAVLLDNTAMDSIVDQIHQDDFYRDAHRKIFNAMLDMSERSEAIDFLTLEDTLKAKGDLDAVGGPDYIASLTEIVPSLANVRSYARIVADKAIARRLIHAASEILQSGFQQTDDLETYLSGAEQKIFDVIHQRSDGSVIPLKDLIRQSFDSIEKLYQSDDQYTGVPSGYNALDQKTSGFQRGDLIILAARPSMGKTSLALNIAQNAAMKSKVPTLFFSLEMSKEALAMRILCSEARVDHHKLRSGYLGDADWSRLALAAGQLSEAPLYIDDTPAIRVLEMRAKARRLQAELAKQKQNLGLICMDYLQLASPPAGRHDSREREISEISRGLKGLAKELSLPVLALSQLSRKVESRDNKRPQLADLRESGAIEQDADVIMFIYRDEYYNKDSDEKGTAELIIGKQRNGPTGRVRLQFSEEFTRFESLSLEHDEA